jgi:ribosomal-protein-alanine N-acetyltransferase
MSRITAMAVGAAIPLTASLAAPLAVPLAAMHRVCFPDDPWDADALERILGLSGSLAYLAWQEDNPVGFVLARDLGDEVEILSLGVLPAWRRRGFGRALLAAVAAEAAARHSGGLVLEVATDNEAARRLYAGFGFVAAGRRPRYYRRTAGTADALILRRDLNIAKPVAESE